MTDYWEEVGIKKPQQIVVAAACRFGSTVLVGARHWDNVMRSQFKFMKFSSVHPSQFEEGFIDQFGEFLTREQALLVVLKNGQPFNPERNGSETELFSEGLY